MKIASELYGIGGKVFLDHKSDFKYNRVVEFSEIKPRKLFDLIQSVNQRVSVNKQLSASLGYVKVVFKKALYCKQCFMIQRLDGSFFEHLLKEGFAQNSLESVSEIERASFSRSFTSILFFISFTSTMSFSEMLNTKSLFLSGKRFCITS